MKKPLLVLALSCAALALPSSAFGQATRTWVSGVGDDANPCSRTAPCKTFAGAISKTATGGEIDALDPGGFGTLTVSKSITIDGAGTLGSVLSSGTNAFNINIAAGGGDPARRVVLRNLTINGDGTTAGVKGINITTNGASTVRLENVRIFGFSQCGVCLALGGGTGNTSRVTVADSTIADNGGDGILANPTVTASPLVENRITVTNSRISGNGGAAVKVFTSAPTKAFVYNSLLTDNVGDGILADGAESRFRLSNNDISGNGQGLRTLNAGQILSFGNNHIRGNTIDGVPSSVIPAG